MPTIYVNLDAAYLAELSAKLSEQDSRTAARLLSIADNLQRMDERSTSAYSRGFAEGEEAFKLQNSNLRKQDGPANLEEALAIWKGETSKLPPVEKVAHKAVLTADDLDLDDDFEKYLEESFKKAREKRKSESNKSTVRNTAKA